MSWLIGVFLLLAVSLVIQSGLVAYAAYVLIAVLLLTRLLTRGGLQVVDAQRRISQDEAEVGEVVQVAIQVRNRGPFPIPWLLLEDLLPMYALLSKPPRLQIKGKRLQIRTLWGRQRSVMKYRIGFGMRGFYQIGPLVAESGDLFGLHRRYRLIAPPAFVTVYPKIVPLAGYDVMSRRPIGDIRLTHRLYEDPTRIAGVRPYEPGDPLNRVHWRATARTGRLHSKIYDPTSMAGATILLDCHAAGYPPRGEPHRSDLAVTTAASLAYAVQTLGQQVGLITNAADAAERLATETLRNSAERSSAEADGWERVRFARAGTLRERPKMRRPLIVPTRRSTEQFQQIREMLARAEIHKGLTFPELLIECTPRLPRDASIMAVLPIVSPETAAALGNLHRIGFAVTVVLIMLPEGEVETAYGRLAAENIRDVRPLASEAELPELCSAEVNRTPLMVEV